MPASAAWNESTPAGSDLASSIDDSMRTMKRDVRERLAIEHVWNVDTTNDGKHTFLTLAPGDNVSALSMRTAPSVTGSNATPLIDLAYTWNTSGSPTAFKLNVTNTGSGASAKLFDLQIGGSSKFNVDKAGNFTAAGAFTGNAITGAAGSFTTLAASGAATFSSTLSVGAVNGQTISSAAAFTGSLSVGTTFSVGGTSTYSDALTIASTGPSVYHYDTTGSANQRKTRMYIFGGNFRISLLNDDLSERFVAFQANIATGAIEINGTPFP